MAATPWTNDDDTRLRDLHTAETPVRRIAVDMGRSKAAVSRRIKHLGLTGDRTLTSAATAANVADAKARRAVLELRLLDDAERLREQVWQPHRYWDWGGKDHDFAELTADEPTPTDKLKLMQAVGVALDRSLKIAAHDADAGITEAVGMLDAIAAAIAAAAGVDEPA